MTKPTGNPRGRPPKVKTDVVVTDGGYSNVFLSVGGKSDRSAQTRYTMSAPMQQTELEDLYTGDGLARRIIDLPAEEMVRAGYEIEGVEDQKKIKSALENINAVGKLCNALRWSSLHGGALVVLLVNDGGTLEDPLEVERSTALEQIRVYDRWQVSHHLKYSDPADMRFGKTQIYQVSPSNGAPYMVHETRCIVLDGMPLPDRKRDSNDGWGASRLQQCYTQLERFGMSHVWANALLERAQQAVHGIPGLTDLMRSKQGEDLVRKRVDLVDMARSINNTVVIDAAESYDLKATSLAGVSDLVDRFGMALSAVSGIPESLLFGKQHGGLASTGQSDIENWYAKVKQMQQTMLLPALDRIITIQMHALKMYTKDYLVTFNPLFVPTDKEQAEVKSVKAKTYETLNNIGALDASEIRKMLPDDGYAIENIDLLPEVEDEKEPEAGV